jgi:hypothetical protein
MKHTGYEVDPAFHATRKVTDNGIPALGQIKKSKQFITGCSVLIRINRLASENFQVLLAVSEGKKGYLLRHEPSNGLTAFISLQ